VQGFGLCLMWFLGVFGRQNLPLAAQDLPAPMAQPLPYAVVGPAALTHIRVRMGVNVRVRRRPLDFVGLLTAVVVFVRTHAPSVTRSPGVHQGRRSTTARREGIASRGKRRVADAVVPIESSVDPERRWLGV